MDLELSGNLGFKKKSLKLRIYFPSTSGREGEVNYWQIWCHRHQNFTFLKKPLKVRWGAKSGQSRLRWGVMWIQSKKIYGTVVFFSALSDILIFKTLTKHQSNPPLDGAGNKFKSKIFPPDRIVKWLLFADKNLQRVRASTGYFQLYCQGKPICLWRFSAFLSFFILYLHVGRDIGGGEAGSHPVDFTLPAKHHQ